MPDPHLVCPTCSEERALRRSHLRVVDLPSLLFRLRPYRCLICNRRFYSHVAPRAAAAKSGDESGQAR